MIKPLMDIPQIIQLPKFLDPRGNLSFIEENDHVPFSIRRCYWIYDVPGGEIRGAHAYKTLHEFIVALSGSFDVVLSDGLNEMRFNLSRSYYGLYVPPMYWRSMENFSTNSVALMLADAEYDELDYLREYDKFRQLKNGNK